MPEYVQKLSDQKRHLEREISENKTEQEKIKSDVKSSLQSKNTTLEKLEEYSILQKSLKANGLSFDDYDHLAKLISKAKESNYNIQEITTHLAQEKLHNQRMLELKKENNTLEDSIKEKNETMQSKSEEISSIQTRLYDLRQQYKTEQSAIDYIKKLIASKISTSMIQLWADTQTKSGLDAAEFHGQIKDMNNILEFKTKLKGEISNLKLQKEKINGKIKGLKKTAASLESQCDSLNTKITEATDLAISKITETAKKGVSKIQNTINYHDVTIRSRIDSSTDYFQDRLSSKIKEFENEANQQAISKEKEARYEFLEPLHKIVTKSQGEKTDVYRSMISLLTGLEPWLESTGHMVFVKSKTKRLKEEFQGLLAEHAAKN